jgi:hypothetical protein
VHLRNIALGIITLADYESCSSELNKPRSRIIPLRAPSKSGLCKMVPSGVLFELL